MTESNRRQFAPENTDGTLQVLLVRSDFEGPEDSGDLIPAKMLDQSDNGLFLEIDRDLVPGAMVRIKKILKEESSFEDVCYIWDGQVIWCEKVYASTERFGVGIKILRKVIQTNILTSRFR